jgi:hypothetical protein
MIPLFKGHTVSPKEASRPLVFKGLKGVPPVEA